MRPPYRDVVQNALYGRSRETLSLLCEDDAAEGVLRGVFDVLLPRRRIWRESVRIGRDTGANEFPALVKAVRKFGSLDDFVFVLDGDQRGGDVEEKIRSAAEQDVPVLFLPGLHAPEVWVWEMLRLHREAVAGELRIPADELAERMNRQDAVFAAASDGPSEIAKAKLRGLAEPVGCDVPEVCRIVARLEVERTDSDLQPLVERLEDALERWRSE